MGLFLPVLLLGLTVPANQPTADVKPPVADQIVQVAPLTPRRFDPLEDANGQDDQQRNRTCYTVRSYIFEHRNGYVPEYLGMTTCDPARASGQRHVRGPARLVPAN